MPRTSFTSLQIPAPPYPHRSRPAPPPPARPPQAPDADSLERFLGSLPLISDVVVMSPHGYFGQSNVLGLPDTGGQVVYILDQVILNSQVELYKVV